MFTHESPGSHQKIQKDDWFYIRTRGNHRHFKHLPKPGLVTVAGYPNIDAPTGMLHSIIVQAGLREHSSYALHRRD